MNEINIIEYSKKAHEAAKAKGWWDEVKPDEVYLMLIISELAECMEADRKGKRADRERYEAKIKNSRIIQRDPTYSGEISYESAWKVNFETCIKDTVEDELADTVIRCLDLIGHEIISESFAEWRVGPDWLKSFWRDVKDTLPEHLLSCVRLLTTYTAPIGSSYVIKSIENYCEKNNIDLIWHIDQKMKYNETRSYKHGGKAY